MPKSTPKKASPKTIKAETKKPAPSPSNATENNVAPEKTETKKSKPTVQGKVEQEAQGKNASVIAATPPTHPAFISSLDQPDMPDDFYERS